MTVYLIRHGRTPANDRHLYCGSTDLPLSEAGAEELKALRYRVGDARFYTSGMRRTEQTLALIFGPVAHTVEPDLREMDFGGFEMRGYPELKDDPAYQAWLSGDNEANPTPGGESGAIMTRRAVAAYEKIAGEGRDAVIVTHGGVIAAIMAHLFPEAGRNRYQWQPRPGHGYAVTDGGWISLP